MDARRAREFAERFFTVEEEESDAVGVKQDKWFVVAGQGVPVHSVNGAVRAIRVRQKGTADRVREALVRQLTQALLASFSTT